MVNVSLTNDEVYHMVRLYNTLLDMDLIDDCPVAVETAFDKIVAAECKTVFEGIKWLTKQQLTD